MRPERRLIKNVMQEWMDRAPDNGVAPITVSRHYAAMANRYLASVGNHPMGGTSLPHIDRFKAHLHSWGISPVTVNMYLTHLKTFLRWARERSYIDAVLTDPPFFDNVQYAELMDFCYVWLRRLINGDVPYFDSLSTRTDGGGSAFTGGPLQPGPWQPCLPPRILAPPRKTQHPFYPGPPMTFHQLFLFGLLSAIFAMLIWGRFRYDAVAFVGLVVAYLAGVVPKDQVFSGFGHPATVIVALALIASRGLSASGAVEAVTRYLVSATRGPGLHIAIMSATAATLSAGMNNVAALALLMPVDIQAAAKAERSPAVTLMPLSFATILGGMITLIGTPPNVVVATFRQQALGETFHMFDFAPVGVVVALAGILFVAGVGWRLIPRDPRKHDSPAELLDLEGYIAEASVPEGCKAVGTPLRGLYRLAEENDVALLGIVRRGKRLPGTSINEAVRKGDHLVLEGGPEPIEQFVGAAGLKYRGSGKHTSLTGEAQALAEVVVPGGAPIEGRSAEEVRLLYRHGVTLLGVSRRGRPFREQVRKLTVRAGDVLLLLGPEGQLAEVTAWLGALPLAERGLQVVQRHKAGLAVGIFTAAIIAASLDWIYLPVALATVAMAFLGFRILSPFQLYEAVEWPVIVLLGSLIPIGAALETSGGTRLIANLIVGWTGGSSPVVVLAILMVVTMTLSDMLNNVATALIAAPIAVDIATRLGVNPDPFLMAVAVAASCAFLTPIGHKNNTLILGPGGYRFGDYWRMGLPLEALVVAVGLPMILHVWPL